MLLDNQNSISAFDVAAYFLHRADDDAGDLISNLKLQKLLYYAQGTFLAVTEEALFPEEIEAWMHGPVVPLVYHRYKEYQNQGIPVPENIDASLEKFNDDQRDLLSEVYNVFGQYSAWRLRDMTHSEKPWKDREFEIGTSPVITKESMKNYFNTLLVDGE